MPLTPRRTAIVRFVYSRVDESTPLPLDQDRAYEVILTIEGDSVAARQFSSPFGDERWREIVDSLRQCTSERTAPPSGDETDISAAKRRNKRRADEVEGAGRSLYRSLAELRPELRAFLDETGPRRLVIESKRPEIHALPWEALTNEHRQLLAQNDLSIVRCQSAFNVIALPSLSVLNAFAVLGPNTPTRSPLASLESVGVMTEAGRDIGIRRVETDEDAQLVHLVAHGDPYQGTIALKQGELLLPTQLSARYRNRLMVLLWSCYSAMVHSTGDSVTMAMQRAGNRFVVSFSAPLDFDAGALIATQFYDQVFGEKGQQDPETAITRIRSALRDTAFEFCDWASMTLWLERPVDLSRLPLGRVRLPKSSWSSDASIENIPLPIRREFERTALGDLRLVSGVTLATPLPTALVRQWTGPVVHLDGPKALLDNEIFEALDLNPGRDRNPHPADVFLHLLDHLATYPFALLVWTSVTDGIALLAQTLDRLPPNVGMLLISAESLSERWPGHVVSGSQPAAEASRPVRDGREGFLQLVQEERFERALNLQPRVDYDDVEYWSSRYVACVKTTRWDQARECIDKLQGLDAIEKNLLEGNFALRRRGDQLAAMDAYQHAADGALQAERWREFARVRQELAYLVEEMGDRGLAEQFYLGALNLLNETPPEQRNTLWSSALGRVLRDYAHLLAKAGDPRALPFIRRAAAIHAMDGRRTQVAYCFVTRSELECRLGKHDDADETAQKAGIVFNAAKNTDGLVDAVDIAARNASSRNRDRQALSILRRALDRPLRPGLLGRLFLQIAEVCWESGRVDDAAANARGALAMLTGRYRRELAAAQRLKEFTDAMTYNATRRVAALAGRMVGSTSEGSLAEYDDLRGRLCRCLVDERIGVLVCSAARGADLLALDIALKMGIPCRIVLPFDVDTFRERSVSTENGLWTSLYQRAIDDAASRNDLVILDSPEASFTETNTRILDDAARLAANTRPLALVVWEGRSRGAEDMTAGFKAAAAAQFDVREIEVER